MDYNHLMSHYNLSVVLGSMGKTAEAEGERKIFKWVSKDTFIKNVYEIYLPPYNDFCPNVNFAAKKEWGEVAKWFNGIARPQLELSDEMKNYVSEVVSEQKNDRKPPLALNQL